MDMVWRGATATTDQTHTDVDEPARVLRHVLRRAEIDIAALDGARHSGVRLRRERRGGHGAHALHRVQHGDRSDAAVASDNVRAPSLDLRTVMLRTGSIKAVAIFVD